MIDPSVLAHHASVPGIDPRTWVSYGTVQRKKRGSDPEAVQYTDVGPLVLVLLHPQNVTIQCRVANQSAGDGEGEWSPFVEGDEVVVVVPGGNEREGGVILGRLQNAKDKVPARVAGMDAKKNNLSYVRKRTPHVTEVAGGWMVRQATTGAFISVKETGEITIGGGEGAFVAVRPDFVGMQSSDGTMLVQLDEKGKNLRLEASGGVMSLKGSASSIVTDQLALVTGGLFPAHHAATAESTIAVVASVLQALGAACAVIGPTPLTGASLAALLELPGIVAIMNAGIALAAGASIAPYAAALSAALSARTSDASGTSPGVGTPSLLLG